MVGYRNAHAQRLTRQLILSGIPMVGYRNARRSIPSQAKFYQAFRWWGIGT